MVPPVTAPVDLAAAPLSRLTLPNLVVLPIRSSSALSWVSSVWAAVRALVSCEPDEDA